MRSVKEGRGIQAFPHVLPDGRHFLFMQLGVAAPGVYVGRLDADEPMPALVTAVAVESQRINVNGPVRATYAAGHLFYLDNSDRTVIAQAFDVRRLHLSGAAVTIAENVENPAPGLDAYDVSPTGMLVYRPQPPLSDHVGPRTAGSLEPEERRAACAGGAAVREPEW